MTPKSLTLSDFGAETPHVPPDSEQKEAWRDAGGRLLPGHPGLKKLGDVSRKTKFERKVRAVAVPSEFRRMGLEGVWYALVERAMLGDTKAVMQVLRLSGVCGR